MKINKNSVLFLFVAILVSCSESESEDKNYVFVEQYCSIVTVGGIIGIQEKCYEIGDIVTAESKSDTFIMVRIADGPQINDKVGPWSFQELLEVPLTYVEVY